MAVRSFNFDLLYRSFMIDGRHIGDYFEWRHRRGMYVLLASIFSVAEMDEEQHWE